MIDYSSLILLLIVGELFVLFLYCGDVWDNTFYTERIYGNFY